MNPVSKALWFIDSHFADDLTLTEIAAVAGVSRFHLARAFGMTTGFSVMQYVRGRRLSEAARLLADGAPDILTLALDVGYGSHEAFTRAFREQFGVTPEQAWYGGTITGLLLMEAFQMNSTDTVLQAPRIEEGRALLVAGLEEWFSSENMGAIPALWQRFGPHIGHVPGQVGNVTYGVCYNTDDTGRFDYSVGVEVADFEAACRLRAGADCRTTLRGIYPNRAYLGNTRHIPRDLQHLAAETRLPDSKRSSARALR